MANKIVIVPGDRNIKRINKEYSLDGTSLGAEVQLWQDRSSKKLMIIGATIRLSSVSGGTVPDKFPEISIGTTGSFDDIFESTKLYGLSTTDDTYYLNTKGIRTLGPISGEVKAKVQVASDATTYNMKIQLLGYSI
jgi:hypothetical protein